jgi:Mn2+/Fe2+ NRAMP family transporter
MADIADEREARTEAPSTFGSRLRFVGPGLIIAATGVGAGDMVSSLNAGTEYGMIFLWAILVGAFIKFYLTEGIGRWYMATGQTILRGWRSLGRFVSGFFVVYLLILTFVFGGAAISASALAFSAMFPILPLEAWAVLHGILGFVVCIIGRYKLFERIMEVFVALMFITVVGLAILLAPNLGELASGVVPTRFPEGSLLFILSLIGGVGATFTLASYNYWVRERGWGSPPWIPMMRLDLIVGYIMTAVFMVAMLVVGAELLFASGASISEEEGLVALADPIQERFGVVARWLFLVGFWAAATSSIVGAWNGLAYLFADAVRTSRDVPEERAEEYLSEKSVYFRGMLVWITFPPMLLLFFQQPVLLIIVYAALGALFLPFLAITLLWLLNSRRVAPEHRNGIVSNIILVASVLLFVFLGIQEVLGAA